MSYSLFNMALEYDPDAAMPENNTFIIIIFFA